MESVMTNRFRNAAVGLLIAFAPAAMPAQTRAEAAKAKMPDGPGKDTTARVCSACHSVEVSTSRRESREGWNAIVVNMADRGAKGSDDEFGEIVEYLAVHYPPVVKVNVNSAPATDLQTSMGLTADEAAAIVKYREANGKFQSFADLCKVPGVPAAKLESKKPGIVY